MKKFDLICVYLLLILYTALFTVEFVINQLTHSVLVLVDAYFNLFILTTLILLLVGHKTGCSHSIRNTFGWVRISILGKLITQCFFAALAFALLVESTQLLIHSMHEPSNIQPQWNLIAAVISLFGHLLSYSLISRLMREECCAMCIHDTHLEMHFVIRGIQDECTITAVPNELNDERLEKQDLKNGHSKCTKRHLSTNRVSTNVKEIGEQAYSRTQVISKRDIFLVRAARLLRTLCSSMCLFISSAIQLSLQLPISRNCIPEWLKTPSAQQALDPAFGIASVLVICSLIYPEMKQSGLILLQTMPSYVDIERLRRRLLLRVPNVREMHELHIWCLTSFQIIATAHLKLNEQFRNNSEYDEFISEVNSVFHEEGVSIVTVQPEFIIGNESNKTCLFSCATSKSECAAKLCCHVKDDQGECSAINV